MDINEKQDQHTEMYLKITEALGKPNPKKSKKNDLARILAAFDSLYSQLQNEMKTGAINIPNNEADSFKENWRELRNSFGETIGELSQNAQKLITNYILETRRFYLKELGGEKREHWDIPPFSKQ